MYTKYVLTYLAITLAIALVWSYRESLDLHRGGDERSMSNVAYWLHLLRTDVFTTWTASIAKVFMLLFWPFIAVGYFFVTILPKWWSKLEYWEYRRKHKNDPYYAEDDNDDFE